VKKKHQPAENNSTEKFPTPSIGSLPDKELKPLSKFDLEKLIRELISENQGLREQNANLLLRDQRFRLISRNSPDTILFQNEDLVYIWVMNSTPLLAVDQVIGKTDFDLLSSEEAADNVAIKKDLLQTGRSYYKEITRNSGDHKQYFSLLFQPWCDDGGKIIGIATYFREITDQKKVEEELKKQLDGEILVAEIASRFITAEITHIDEQIPEALQKMADYLTAEQGYIRFIDPQTLVISKGFEWNNPSNPGFSLESDGLSFSQFTWAKDHLLEDLPIFVPDASEIPDEAAIERDFLIKSGIRSMVILPVSVSGTFRGYIGFSSRSPHPFWSEREKGLLDLFRSTIVSVLERYDRENALDESRELYQKLVDLTPDATFLVQNDNIFYSNRAGAQLLGLTTSDQINNYNFETLLSKKNLHKLQHHISRSKEVTGEPSIDISFTNHLGIEKTVDFRSIPIKLKGKDAYLAIVVDITHRKNIEKEIEGNRRFLNEILNISPLAIFVYDRAKECFAYFNNATCDLFGCAAEQLNLFDRSRIIQMVHPDDRERAIAGQMELSNLPVGKVIEGEYRWIKLDGSICWLHMYQTAISRSSKDGSTLQSLTIVQDITDIVRTSMELRQSEEDFRNLVDNIPGAVYRATYSNQFSTLYLSDYFTRMTSIDKNLIIDGQTSWLDMIHPDDRQKLTTGVKKAAQNRTPFEIEYRVKRADGEYFWLVDTGRITYDDDGKPIYVNGIMTDITARKQDYEAMRQLSQDNLRLLAQARRDSETKTLLLNEVNHRVKNNMASIIGLLEMESNREIKSEPDYQSALTDLRNRISGLATVHNILSSNQWSPVQLELFTRKIIENAASSSPLGRKVTIDIISQDKNLWINARQATALALIINELTTNSVRHAFPLKEKGTITVTIRKEDKDSNRIRLIFADDGPGWPQDIIDGTGGNVGMQVMRLSVASPLNGEIKFENHNGAVAIVTFNLAPQRELLKSPG
jgi:PAS domain S-box-containing protein